MLTTMRKVSCIQGGRKDARCRATGTARAVLLSNGAHSIVQIQRMSKMLPRQLAMASSRPHGAQGSFLPAAAPVGRNGCRRAFRPRGPHPQRRCS